MVSILRGNVVSTNDYLLITVSSLARTLGSNLTQGMVVCLRLFCVYVVPCVGSGLATSWFPVQGVLPSVLGLRNWSETKRFTDALSYKVGVTGKREREWLFSRCYDDRFKNDAGKMFGSCSKHGNIHTFSRRVIPDITNIVRLNSHLILCLSCKGNANLHVNNYWIVVSCCLVFPAVVISVSTALYRHVITCTTCLKQNLQNTVPSVSLFMFTFFIR
jgi:hypothetical protein